MRKVIAGDGSDSTAATQTFLESTVDPIIRHLFVIGPPNGLNTFYLTDHEAPVYYAPYGTFFPAVVKRDSVKVKIGLDVQEMKISWSPANQTAGTTIATASPFQLAAQHFFDNWPALVLRCFMPTPGDAQTLGATIWWGGRVHTAKVKRNSLVFNCKDFTDVLDQKVPSTVVEITNTLASAAAITLPTVPVGLPVFSSVAGSSENLILADCTSPSSGNIYSGDEFAGGYMVFLSGIGATLSGCWSAISGNGEKTVGLLHHSIFSLYSALPWPPTPGVDNFYVSKQAPVDLTEEAPSGFPYVPAPQQAA